MKKISALILSLASLGFCLDEYLPIEATKIQVNAGYMFMVPTGNYDQDGTKQDSSIKGSPMMHRIPLQIKYGIIKGLDLELFWEGLITNKDNGNLSGMNTPEIAVKYALLNMGAGAYINYTIPFVTGNLDQGGDPTMSLDFGAVYQKRFGNFRMTGMAGYQLNFEGDIKKDSGGTVKAKDGNVIHVLMKPEAMWTEFIGTYLGIIYRMADESELKGVKQKDDSYSLALSPGLNAMLLKGLAYEISVPFTLMGKSSDAYWGISAAVYVTLPM